MEHSTLLCHSTVHCHVITCYHYHGTPLHTIIIRHHYHDASLYTIRQMLPHYHGALSYAIRHPLPLSGCSPVHYWYLRPPYQSAENQNICPSFFRTQWSRPLEFRSTPSCLFSLRMIFEHLKLESRRDVSITSIGDTLSYGFPQTVCDIHCTLCAYFPPHGLSIPNELPSKLDEQNYSHA